MEFRILGPLDVVGDDGELLDLGAPKQRTLLALLLIHRNQVLSVDRIIDELWGEDPPKGGVKTLRFHVSVLRRLLKPGTTGEESVLVTRHPGYVLEIDEEEVDAARFEQLASLARQLVADEPQRAWDTLAEALSLWRGRALEDVAYESFAQLEAHRLEELHLVAVEDRIEAELTLGRHEEVIGELETLVAEHPLQERLWGQLMLALYRAGRQAEALRTYTQLRDQLVEELGIDPSPELQHLEQQILTQDPRLDPVTATQPTNNLPAELSSFIGRDEALRQLGKVIPESRLVTLVGPGGIGKTRLALAAAQGVVADYADGVWLVELAPLSEPELVPHTIGEALSVEEQPGRPVADVVAEFLEPRILLLLVDNCEHLVDSVADLATQLLRACPTLHILATSREPLHVEGETQWSVPPLALPAEGADDAFIAESEAVRLFTDRARAVRPDLTLGVETVAEICQRLEGIPLAIELAAARLNIYSIDQIADLLDDRLGLLTAGWRTAEPKQQTLRATLDWSYQLLTEPEQALLRRVSVFRGGFAAEAGGAIGHDELVPQSEVGGLLAHLVDVSMLTTDPETSRYRLLETIREYALEKLRNHHETETHLRRHATYFVGVAEARSKEWLGSDEAAWIGLFELEHDNLRAALRWSLDNGEETMVVRLAAPLARFWLRGLMYAEGRRWIHEVLAANEKTPSKDRAEFLVGASLLMFQEADRDGAQRLAGELLAVARELGEDGYVARALDIRALMACYLGDVERHDVLHEEALAIVTELGGPMQLTVLHNYSLCAIVLGRWDLAEELAFRQGAVAEALEPIEHAYGYQNLGWLSWFRGDLDRAGTYLAESRTHLEGSGNTHQLFDTISAQGWVALARGDLETARICGEDALSHTAHSHRARRALGLLGRVALARGDYDEARTLTREALVKLMLPSEPLDHNHIVHVAPLVLAADDPVLATRLLGSLRARAAVHPPPTLIAADIQEAEQSLRDVLGDEEFDKAYAEGLAMPATEARKQAIAGLEKLDTS